MRQHAMTLFIRAIAGCLIAGTAAAQTLDPVFANSFESGLIGFGPPLNIVAAPTTDVPTANVPLQVTLSDPAGAPTFVAITSSVPSRVTVTGGGATVATGQTTADVLVSGIVGDAAPVTLFAHFGNTLGASVQVQQALNETGVAAEADFCIVQFPLAFTVRPGELAPTVFAQLFESGVTEAAGAPPGWIAQFGYGAQASDPRLLDGWQFADATYNTQMGNNDEFQTSFHAPATETTYSFAYRFSGDAGGSWTYCDTDGAGSSMGSDFSTAALGQMTVAATAAHLVINELDYDQIGTDTLEFVELYNGSAQAIDTSNLALAFINGNNNVEYLRVSLAPVGNIAPGQYLVVKSSGVVAAGGALTLPFPTMAADQIQNGAPDGIALIDTSSLTVIDALSYEGAMTAAVINGFVGSTSLVEGTVLPGSVADSNATVGSLVRLPNGTDTDDAASDWKFTTTPTPGAANVP